VPSQILKTTLHVEFVARFTLPGAEDRPRCDHTVRLRCEFLRACLHELQCFTLPPDEEGGNLLVFQILSLSGESKRFVKTSPSVLQRRLMLPAMVQFFEVWSQDCCDMINMYTHQQVRFVRNRNPISRNGLEVLSCFCKDLVCIKCDSAAHGPRHHN
jgi:hypothetical protein